ncbi:sugar phosphate nucleotidyltransferase [Paracoccaceae bacterium]|nr:sugar phosphate nucleotidyltransferase [Paracoccaceae bacterium]
MNLIFTMAGRGRRFVEVGITQPKYLLEINKRSILEKVIGSFNLNHFSSITFICLKEHVRNYKIHLIIDKIIGSHKCVNIITVNETTGGQAETAYFYLKETNIENIVIFNVDTFFEKKLDLRNNFSEHCSGSIQLFKTKFGEHYSFALPSPGKAGLKNLIKVTEKVRISPYASTGLYLFKNSKIYNSGFEKFISNKNKKKYAESYISLIYEELIQSGKTISGFLCDPRDIKVVGTPQEYSNFLKSKSIDKISDSKKNS